MKKNSQIIFMAFCFAIGMSACSVESGVTADGVLPQAPKLNANLEGVWSTGCRYESGYYALETLTFKGQAFESNLALYTTTGCVGNPIEKKVTAGTTTVLSQAFWELNGYNVDFSMKDENGLPMTLKMVTVVEGTKLYLPRPDLDTESARATYVDRSRPYTKVGG